VTNDGGPDYEAWLRGLDGEPDSSLSSDDGGTPAAGFSEFTREVFRDQGPISGAAFDQAYNERQLLLARHAVALVEADIERAAGFDALTFDVAIRPLSADDDYELLVVSYRGNFQTPVMVSLRHPESTAEVADNIQDHIAGEIHAAWPVCPTHDRGLYAQVDQGDAVWYCRSGSHAVSKIGELGLQPA
jgi:hypothetical protein